MSVCGETLSAITGMEEACATARARVEDLVAEADDLRRCLSAVITQRDEARAEVERLKAQHLERHLESWEQYMQDNDVKRAFRRGAEAMRLACQEWCRAWENNGEAIADALADLRVEE
jgi:chromosome segregation ATPase